MYGVLAVSRRQHRAFPHGGLFLHIYIHRRRPYRAALGPGSRGRDLGRRPGRRGSARIRRVGATPSLPGSCCGCSAPSLCALRSLSRPCPASQQRSSRAQHIRNLAVCAIFSAAPLLEPDGLARRGLLRMSDVRRVYPAVLVQPSWGLWRHPAVRPCVWIAASLTAPSLAPRWPRPGRFGCPARYFPVSPRATTGPARIRQVGATPSLPGSCYGCSPHLLCVPCI